VESEVVGSSPIGCVGNLKKKIQKKTKQCFSYSCSDLIRLHLHDISFKPILAICTNYVLNILS